MRNETMNTPPPAWMKVLFLIALLGLMVPCGRTVPYEPGSGRYFAMNSTWYERIPAGAAPTAHSDDYVREVMTNSPVLAVSYRHWSVPVFYASADTAWTTVTGVSEMVSGLGWNVVPIPRDAAAAGNSDRCAGRYTDGHMVVVSPDRRWAWDFFQAAVCGGIWSAKIIRLWDLSLDGVNQPYDGLGSAHLAPTPLLHGLITYAEIQRGRIDHAVAFAYNSNASGDNGVYPAERQGLGGRNTRQWALHIGQRLQLDPSVDCEGLDLNRMGKIICRALQEYGMIFVVNAGPGNNAVYAESLEDKRENWAGVVGSIASIPLARFRVVDPVYPNGASGQMRTNGQMLRANGRSGHRNGGMK